MTAAGGGTVRRIEAASFPDIEIVSAAGSFPVFKQVAPTALSVDESYQRNLSERSRTLIRKLTANWDWRAFKPPVVVLIGDGYHVIDGQHTAIAAATRGEPLIPVMVVDAPTIADRAFAFVRQNRDRITVTPAQMHQALVAAGDEDALTLVQVCERAGVRLLRQPPGLGNFKVGDFMGVTTLKGIIGRRFPIGAGRILRICVAAKMAPITAAIARAVECLVFEPAYVGKAGDDEIALVIRSFDAVGDATATEFARKYRIPQWRGLAVELFKRIEERGLVRSAA